MPLETVLPRKSMQSPCAAAPEIEPLSYLTESFSLNATVHLALALMRAISP